MPLDKLKTYPYREKAKSAWVPGSRAAPAPRNERFWYFSQARRDATGSRRHRYLV
jgi:hypothetical protein